MPKTANDAISKERQEYLIDKGGLSAATKLKRENVFHLTESFFQTKHGISLAEAMHLDSFEDYLMELFQGLKKNNGDFVSRNYLESIRSNMRMKVMSMFDNKVDITSEKFSRLDNLFVGLRRELKENGKGDTKHYPPLPENVLAVIYENFRKITELITAKAEGEFDKAEEIWDTLPESYQKNPNLLLMRAALFIVIITDIRRGREGLVELTKDHYALRTGATSEDLFYVRMKGESSKNHKDDNEDACTRGIILFQDGGTGYNPGMAFHLYLKYLNPDNRHLFQRIKKFKTRRDFLTAQCLFDDQNVGKNTIGSFLPDLTKSLNLEHHVNHSLRATAIQILKKHGFGDRDIAKIKGLVSTDLGKIGRAHV